MFDGEKSRHAQDLGGLLELKGIAEFRFAAICGIDISRRGVWAFLLLLPLFFLFLRPFRQNFVQIIRPSPSLTNNCASARVLVLCELHRLIKPLSFWLPERGPASLIITLDHRLYWGHRSWFRSTYYDWACLGAIAWPNWVRLFVFLSHQLPP